MKDRNGSLTVFSGSVAAPQCDSKTLEVYGNFDMWFRMTNRLEEERRPITPEYKATLRNEHCETPTIFQSEYNYGNAFYSYRHGNVHVIVLNSYSPCTPGATQYRWLRQELQDQVDRTKTPWVMVVTHQPIYTTFFGHGRATDAEHMETLFNRYGVNFVFSGHDHGYMRSNSLGPNRVVDKTEAAPIYFIVGTGGSSEGPPSRYKSENGLDYYTASRSIGVTGFGQLTVYNATHALWEFHTNQIEKDTEDWYLRNIKKAHVDEAGELGTFRDKVVLRNHFA